MEQNHLHGQQWEFRIQNLAQKTKKSDVKIILISLACLTLIRLSLCMSTGEREREREREREKIFIKKKNSKSFRNHFTIK